MSDLISQRLLSRASRARIDIVTVLLAAAALWMLSTAFAHAQVSPPDDLRIELRSISRIPSDELKIESVVISAAGLAQISEISGPDGVVAATEIQLSVETMARIYAQIVQDEFFNLEPEYIDETIYGGDAAELTITVSGRTHTVRTTNIRVYAFDRIAVIINRELPRGHRILYNALYEENYKAVER